MRALLQAGGLPGTYEHFLCTQAMSAPLRGAWDK